MTNTSAAWERIEVAVGEDGVAIVTLNRPPVNAFDQKMYDEVDAFFSDPDQAGPDIRAIVLRGAGKHFCAGNDLGEFETMTPANAPMRMQHVRRALFAIQFCVVPVIAAVHGTAVGTGMALVCSCDFAVAAEDARLGLPELTVGVMGGARHLARLAPEPLVRRMFFTGEVLSARTFKDAGGTIELCGPDAVMETALSLARKIAALSPTAVRMSKRTLDHTENMGSRQGYEIEQVATITMSGHADSKEAVRAVREKRRPRFRPANS